ncbi:MAG: hypothetical protein K2L22_11960 [Muribaculaceae bacterium]|nr:hypothetical protein [Muribaculaceae bacterium]
MAKYRLTNQAVADLGGMWVTMKRLSEATGLWRGVPQAKCAWNLNLFYPL